MLAVKKTNSFSISHVMSHLCAMTQLYQSGWLFEEVVFCLLTSAWVVRDLSCWKIVAWGLVYCCGCCFVCVKEQIEKEPIKKHKAVMLSWVDAGDGGGALCCVSHSKEQLRNPDAKQKIGKAPWESWHLLVLSEVRALNAMFWPTQSWNISSVCHLAGGC